MERIGVLKREKAQKKYRKKQSNKGLVRYEIQIKEESKIKFEELVEAAAEEYDRPWDKRRRMALARADVFDDITQGTLHEFNELKSQISALQQEVQALAPKFFVDKADTTPLPSAIGSLPDDPAHLKILLTKVFSEGQQAKRQAEVNKRSADQFSELYKVAVDYNERLVAELQRNS